MKTMTSMVCGALLLVASAVQAGGFLIYEHGAAGTAMASSRTALSDDISCMYFNPAAITELPGLQLQVGTTGILPFVSFEAAGVNDRTYISHDLDGNLLPAKPVNDGMNSVDAKVKGFTPIHLYATYRFDDAGLALGFGLNNPFGLGTYWPGDWDGRFIGTETEIQTFFNQFTVALDVAKLAGFKSDFKLSVSASYLFVFATAHLAKHIDLRVAEAFFDDIHEPWGEMRMDGHAIGHGWNASVYAELPGLVSIGGSIRGGFDFRNGGTLGLPFSGEATFWFNPAGYQAVERLSLSIPDKTNGNVTIDLPLHMNFGIALLAIDRLKITADFLLARFESYDELLIGFDCVDDEVEPCKALEQDPILKEWGDSIQVSLGLEYLATDYLAVRAGFGIVTSPVPDEHYDPSLPDGFRYLFSGGAGYQADWWKLDFGYMLAMWEDEKDNKVGNMDTSGNPNGRALGTYSTMVHLFALSFSMMF